MNSAMRMPADPAAGTTRSSAASGPDIYSEEESLMVAEPKLLHVLVVCSYPLLLLLSLVQATPAAVPFTQQGQIVVKRYRLQLTAPSIPRAGQRFALTVSSPSMTEPLRLVQARLARATSAQALPGQDVSQVPVAIRDASPGVYEVLVRPLLPGWWSVILTVQGPRGAGSFTIPLRVEEPPPPPTWLLWRMGLLTFALVTYAAAWANERRDAPDSFLPLHQEDCIR